MTQDPEKLLELVRFNADGLVAAIAQDHVSGQVLMMAWMNRESLAETLRSGAVAYWSRSRGEIWRKGQTSGQTQRLVDLRLDCDGDAILLLVEQTGVACHTGRLSCFYRAVRNSEIVEIEMPRVDPETLYHKPNRSER
jgi:phosphoribosyl-AMP cyclohydrolase